MDTFDFLQHPDTFDLFLNLTWHMISKSHDLFRLFDSAFLHIVEDIYSDNNSQEILSTD
jgi:hypothetical protein